MKKILLFCALILLSSCAPIICTFYCEKEELTIIVDYQQVGNGFVSFQAPRGTEFAHIQVSDNGKLVYETDIFVKNYHQNQLVTIKIPEHYHYSTTPKFHN